VNLTEPDLQTACGAHAMPVLERSGRTTIAQSGIGLFIFIPTPSDREFASPSLSASRSDVVRLMMGHVS